MPAGWKRTASSAGNGLTERIGLRTLSKEPDANGLLKTVQPIQRTRMEPMDQYTVLKQYFGHDDFRPGQKPLVDALLAGRDVLGVMPTGAGKSVCYQVPAMLLPTRFLR